MLASLLNRADEQALQELPVLERRLLDRLAPPPSTHEVNQAVHATVTPDDVPRPRARRPASRRSTTRSCPPRSAALRALQRCLFPSPERERRPALSKSSDDDRAQIPTGACDGDHPACERQLHEPSTQPRYQPPGSRLRSDAGVASRGDRPGLHRAAVEAAAFWPTVTLRSIGTSSVPSSSSTRSASKSRIT